MSSFAVQLAVALLLIVLAVCVLYLAATWDDRRELRRVQRRRAITRYTPPANSRPADFDEYGRTIG